MCLRDWDDDPPREEYEEFTRQWLDGCIDVLSPGGSLWVKTRPGGRDRPAPQITRDDHGQLVHLVLVSVNVDRPCSPLVAAAVFCKDPSDLNPDEVLELSDRASVYGDPRTMAKENNKGMRVPMDVWYGKYWGRIQGNNKERRHNHQNQIPEVYLERVIRSCSNEGDLVLDPFTGSGTTCTVARALGRRSIGIEYSPTIAASAWERINTIGMIRTDGGGGSAIVAPRHPPRLTGCGCVVSGPCSRSAECGRGRSVSRRRCSAHRSVETSRMNSRTPVGC